MFITWEKVTNKYDNMKCMQRLMINTIANVTKQWMTKYPFQTFLSSHCVNIYTHTNM